MNNDKSPDLNLSRCRRKGVAAESFDPTAPKNKSKAKVTYPKTEAQIKTLTEVAKSTLLLGSLQNEDLKDVINAMFQRKVKNGDIIINQGDTGDNFYVIESGVYEIYIKENGKLQKVGEYNNSGIFGELALMYNTPRAATVKAVTDGIVWALERDVFREIVLRAMHGRRQNIENTLRKVVVLSELRHVERTMLADSLEIQEYKPNERIINQHDEGSDMYFILEGDACVTINENGKEAIVNKLHVNDYFGEMALITKQPRKASVTAIGAVKVAKLGVESFERLLGPCMDIMHRNIDSYKKVMDNMQNKLL